jgi:hypothetical protein
MVKLRMRDSLTHSMHARICVRCCEQAPTGVCVLGTGLAGGQGTFLAIVVHHESHHKDLVSELSHAQN